MWHKENESMDPTCLVSIVQEVGGGVMLWGTFFQHTLVLFTTISPIQSSMLQRAENKSVFYPSFTIVLKKKKCTRVNIYPENTVDAYFHYRYTHKTRDWHLVVLANTGSRKG